MSLSPKSKRQMKNSDLCTHFAVGIETFSTNNLMCPFLWSPLPLPILPAFMCLLSIESQNMVVSSHKYSINSLQSTATPKLAFLRRTQKLIHSMIFVFAFLITDESIPPTPYKSGRFSPHPEIARPLAHHPRRKFIKYTKWLLCIKAWKDL